MQFEFPQPFSIDRIAWSRDREQKYSDRLTTDYINEVAVRPNEWFEVAESHDSDVWAVFDSDGRYDASSGDVNGLHWVIGDKTFPLDHLKERYHEPGLLAKVKGFNKEPLRDVGSEE